LITSQPPSPCSTGWPAASTISGTTPGRGSVQLPGLVGVQPGSGLIMIPPVSVCHQVSTIGHFFAPITSWYQIQASGLIPSPTVPKSRRLERSRPSMWLRPHFMKARIAVGAV
jgi:hypothetical protein